VSRSGRERPRVLIDRIPVRYLAEGREAIGHLKNVSKAGVFIRGQDLPSPGSPVALQFRSPSGILVDLRGQVRWNTEGLLNTDVPSGFGVRVYEPPREYRDFFQWVLGEAEKHKGDDTPVV
jgi:hypothetical protein